MDKKVIRKKAVGCIIINPEGKLLIVQRNPTEKIYPGKWELPSGKVDLGESVKKALEREVREETGLNVRLPFIRWPTSILRYEVSDEGELRKTTQKNYLIELRAPQQVKLSPEHVAYAWVTPNELPKYDLIQNVDKMVSAAYRRRVLREKVRGLKQKTLYGLRRIFRRKLK